MNNIILLEKKHKKTIDYFFTRFPVTSLYVYKNLTEYGVENNLEKQQADYYGYVKNNKLLALCAFHNAGIAILASPSTYSNYFYEIIEQKNLPFLLTFVNSIPYDYKDLIIKNECFMIYKGNKNLPVYSLKSENIINKNEIIELKSLYEQEYWDYIPDQTHYDEFRRAVNNKKQENCIVSYTINNKTAGIGFIETYSKKISVLGSIYVKKEFRGQKIGEKITLKLINLSLEKNLIPALSVDKVNVHAYSLYKKLGFKEISELCLLQL